MLVATLAAVIAAAAVGQHRTVSRLKRQLRQLQPQQEAATTGKQNLQELQSEIATARAEAELITYLRHPWPRTRLIAALLKPLPEELTLQRLQVFSEGIKKPPAKRSAPSPPSQQDEVDPDDLLPTARDLLRLRKRYDQQRARVVISGVTDDVAALHAYMAELSDVPLFDRAELRSIEIEPGSHGTRYHFVAALRARAGYGQPQGPRGVDRHLAATD